MYPGEVIDVEARDTVTMAPELVRLSLNMAMTHTDVSRSVYDKRLVYGGHTISMAASQLARILPSLAMIVYLWRLSKLMDMDMVQKLLQRQL